MAKAMALVFFVLLLPFAGGCLECNFERSSKSVDVEPVTVRKMENKPIEKVKPRVKPVLFGAKRLAAVTKKTGFNKQSLSRALRGFLVEREEIEGEGDIFVQFVVSRGGKLVATLDERNQKIHSAVIVSPLFRDKRGIGVGSTYGQLRSAYPNSSCKRFTLKRSHIADGVAPTDELRCRVSAMPGVRYDIKLGSEPSRAAALGKKFQGGFERAPVKSILLIF